MIGKKDIEDVIHQVLDERRAIEAETHAVHHRWIEEQIQAEKARREMYRAITMAAAQWSIVALLGAAAAYFGVNVGGAGANQEVSK